MIKEQKKEKILVVRYRFIGDTILTIPFLRNLRMANPKAQIDLLIAPVSADVIINCPYVDNFIYFDTTKKHKYENNLNEKKSFWYYVKFLKSQKYDKAYILKRSFSSAVLVFLAGIKKRIGFNTEARGFLLTKKVPYYKTKHEIDCFLDCLKADDVDVKDNYLENWVDAKSIEKINKIFSEYKINDIKKVLIHATATRIEKCWETENFAQIVEYLSNEKNVQVIFYGSEYDKEKYNEILKLIKNSLKITPINLCGQLNLKESLALTKMSDLLIGADSGNLHMAASVNTNVIGIYGPMNFNKWKAHSDNAVCLKANLNCMPCELKNPCKFEQKCMKLITVQMVISEINRVL